MPLNFSLKLSVGKLGLQRIGPTVASQYDGVNGKEGPVIGFLTLSFPRSLSSAGFLALRLALGAVFLGHGGQKLFGLFDGPGLAKTIEMFGGTGFTPGWLWGTLAACGEFFGGLGVLLGFLTRWSALSLAVVMSVAIVKVHWSGGFFLPTGFEYCAALLGMSLCLFFAGPGKISVDELLTGGE